MLNEENLKMKNKLDDPLPPDEGDSYLNGPLLGWLALIALIVLVALQ